MINAKKIINISERYLSSKKIDKDTISEFYVNPTQDDIKKITDASFKRFNVRQIRFIVDNQNKKVFVCDAFLSLHYELVKVANLNISDINISPYYFAGIASVKNRIPYMLESDEWFIAWFQTSFYLHPYPNKYSKALRELLASNLKWIDQYIVCSPVIDLLREKYKKLSGIVGDL